jgi:hypothetical protein
MAVSGNRYSVNKYYTILESSRSLTQKGNIALYQLNIVLQIYIFM